MKFLVTGGTGFVGSHLVEKLVRYGEVTVLDVVDSMGLIPEGIRDHVDFRLLDICNPESLDELAGHDVVCHLAALSHPGTQWSLTQNANAHTEYTESDSNASRRLCR